MAIILKNIVICILQILSLTAVSGCLGQQSDFPAKGWASEALPKTDDELVRFFTYPRFAIVSTLAARGSQERFYQTVPPGLESLVSDRLLQHPHASSQAVQNAIAIIEYNQISWNCKYCEPTIALGDENAYERDLRRDTFVFEYSAKMIKLAERFYVLGEAGYLPAKMNLLPMLEFAKVMESEIEQSITRSYRSVPVVYLDRCLANRATGKELQPQVESLRQKLEKYENIVEELANQGYWPAMERRMIKAAIDSGYGVLTDRYAKELLEHPDADEVAIAKAVDFLRESSANLDQETARQNFQYLDDSIARDLGYSWYVKGNYYADLKMRDEMREAVAKGYAMGDSSCAFMYGCFEVENGNHAEAERAFRSAIDQGHEEAAMNLFALIKEVEGPGPDVTRQCLVLEKGVELGSPYSASNLAMFYFRGTCTYELDGFDVYSDEPQEFRQRMANLFEARRLFERAVDWFIKRGDEESAIKVNEALSEAHRQIAGLRRTHGLETENPEGLEQQQAEITRARMESDELYQKWLIRDMQRRDNIRIQNSLGR